MTVTSLSWMSDEELLARVWASEESDELHIELAARVDHLLELLQEDDDAREQGQKSC
jgi:hypothetical protein